MRNHRLSKTALRYLSAALILTLLVVAAGVPPATAQEMPDCLEFEYDPVEFVDQNDNPETDVDGYETFYAGLWGIVDCMTDLTSPEHGATDVSGGSRAEVTRPGREAAITVSNIEDGVTKTDEVRIGVTLEPVEYTLTIDSTVGGNVTVPGEGEFVHDYSAEVDLKAMADEGYAFAEWTGDIYTIANPVSANTTITMDDNYSITAVFEPVAYTLTIDSTVGGNVTVPGEGEFVHDYSAEVDLKAMAHEGYVFVKWTGDIYTIANPFSADTTITMDHDYSITAEFDLIENGFVDNPPVEEGLASIAEALQIVYVWRPANQSWDMYWPAAGIDTIGTLQAGTAYWILVDSDCVLEYGTRSWELFEGWNNIAWLPQ